MSSNIPKQMKAVVAAENHSAKVVNDFPVPTPSSDEILVKVEAVTLNPTDWKHLKFMSEPGTSIGCDFCGKVVECKAQGDDIPVKVGDRVAGFVHGGKYNDRGSFAEYVKTDPYLVVKVPDNVDSERASSVGIAGYTAVQALFQRLQLKIPTAMLTDLPPIDIQQEVLIWAGSTAVGQYAIQLARVAGYHVITTASPRNHDLLKKMGAAEVYDYNDKDVPEKIASKHPALSAALDCISEGGTQSLCVKSLGAKGGVVTVLLKPEKEAVEAREDVTILHTLIYTALGHPFSYGKAEFDKNIVTTDRNFITQFTKGDKGLFHSWFSNNLITGNRIRSEKGGIEGIIPALQLLEEGKVSGEKLALTL